MLQLAVMKLQTPMMKSWPGRDRHQCREYLIIRLKLDIPQHAFSPRKQWQVGAMMWRVWIQPQNSYNF